MKGDMSPNCPVCGANPHEECRLPVHDAQAINCAKNPIAIDSILDDRKENSMLEALDEGKAYIKLKSTTSEAFDTAWLSITKANSCLIEKGGGPRCPTCGLDSATLSVTGCPVQVIKMNPRLPKDGALDGVLNVKPDPPAMHAGMPRDPDLLARLKRMYGDNPMKKPKRQE